MSDLDISHLLAKAIERYNALTPLQQRDMWAAQRKSWVIGEMMLEHPEMSRDEVERIYDRVKDLP